MRSSLLASYMMLPALIDVQQAIIWITFLRSGCGSGAFSSIFNESCVDIPVRNNPDSIEYCVCILNAQVV